MISVLIPAYNVSKHIAETLECLFNQTYTNFEAIVVNDGSPDTPALEAAIEPFRDRITYICKPNGGVSSARNAALRVATGEFVSTLDGDDCWLPHCLATLTGMLAANPELDVVFGDTEYFGESVLAGKTYLEVSPARRPVTTEDLIQRCYQPTTTAVLIRTSSIRAIGGWDERIQGVEDFQCYVRLALRGAKFDFTQEILSRYRRLAGGLAANLVRMKEVLLFVYVLFIAEENLPQKLRELAYNQIELVRAELHLARGQQLLLSGEINPAIAELRRANQEIQDWRLSLLTAGLQYAPWGALRYARQWAERSKA